MKKWMILLCLFIHTSLFADTSPQSDQLAQQISLSILGVTIQDYSIPASLDGKILDNLTRGVLGIKRFDTRDFSAYSLAPDEVDELLSYLKGIPAAAPGEESAAVSEPATEREENDLFARTKEQTLEEIREEFGEETARIIEKLRKRREEEGPRPETAAPAPTASLHDYNFENLPIDIIEQIKGVRYLVVPSVDKYSDDFMMDKNVSESTDKTVDDYEITTRTTAISFIGTAYFTVTLKIIDTWNGTIVETRSSRVKGEYKTTEEFENRFGEFDFASEVFWQVLIIMWQLESIEAAERYFDEIKFTHREKAALNAAGKTKSVVYPLLTGAKSFHVDTRIVKMDGRDIYLNKGRIWDVHSTEEFLLHDGENSYLLKIREVHEDYSIARAIWGDPEKDDVLKSRNNGGLNWEFRGGVLSVIGAVDYALIARDLISDGSSTLNTVYNAWPLVSFWSEFELDYSLKAAMDIGIGFSPDITSSATAYLDFSMGLGTRLHLSKLALDFYGMVGMNGIINSQHFSKITALGLGLSPVGEGDVNLMMTAGSFYVKPVVGVSYYLSPGLMLSVKGEYRYSISDNFISVEASQGTGDYKEPIGEAEYFSDTGLYRLDGFNTTVGIIIRM